MSLMRTRTRWLSRGATAAAVAVAPLLLGAPLHAGGVGPDVTVFSLSDIGNYGGQDGFHGYAVGTVSCNRGDAPLNWCNDGGDSGCGQGTTDEDHPVIAQNLYRVKDGRFQQIGMSWLKHGFLSTNSPSGGACTGAQGQNCTGPPLGSNQLGVGCTDPYGSGLNGSRPLGPKSEVNASTGDFPYPHGNTDGTGPPYEQRIKVAQSDIDPALNTGAVFFIEGQYVAPDDAGSGNGLNNASYRPVTIGAGPGYAMSFAGSTVEGQPAISAWKALDAAVDYRPLDVPLTLPTQRFHVARKVTSNGDGTWHYEYAIHNLNADLSADGFAIELPGATITDVGFADIDHHSGEPYDTADWDTAVTDGTVSWSVAKGGENANALRWAATFSFWFDADVAPRPGLVHTLDVFKPHSPTAFDFLMPMTPLFADGFESGNTGEWDPL